MRARVDGKHQLMAALIQKSASAKVHIKGTGDTRASEGAGVRGMIGALVGLLAGPQGVAAGAFGGAGRSDERRRPG